MDAGANLGDGRAPAMNLVIANSTQNHSFQTALAASEAGILRRFVAGMYYDRSLASSRFFEWVLAKGHMTRDITRMRGRRVEGLPLEDVVAMVWPEAVSEVWSRTFLRRLVDPRTIGYARHELFDAITSRRYVRDCDTFHGFDQCAKFSLSAARKRGMVTILDQPIMYRGALDAAEARERRAVGMREPRHPFGYRHHVERKYDELELADYLVVGLDFVKRTFVEGGFPEERIFCVPYGADVTRFAPLERERKTSRSGEFRILYVGPVSWMKGLHHLLDAFELADIPGASLTVIGMMDHEWQEYFENRFRKVSKPFQYLHTVPHLSMERHFAEADVLVFPSMVGGIGLAVYEAMASGLPVITSDGDVVIRDGVDGLVVPERDPEAWAAALTRLSEDEDLRSSLSRNGAERVGAFSWEAYRRGMRDVWAAIESRA